MVDQQFMDQMGSPYLMAHGMGKCMADASTGLTFWRVVFMLSMCVLTIGLLRGMKVRDREKLKF